jgi:adenosine deaminase
VALTRVQHYGSGEVMDWELESACQAEPFAGLFQQVKTAGLKVSIHAGKWAAAANVREAFERFGANRVAQVPFEVCITGNYQSGGVRSLTTHLLVKRLEAALFVTINTDDPSISQITLSDEYRLAVENLGLSQA